MIVFLDLFGRTMTDPNAFIIRFEEYKLNKECLYKLRNVFNNYPGKEEVILEIISANILGIFLNLPGQSFLL